MPLMPDAILGKCQKYREIASVNPSHYAFTFQVPHLIRAGREIRGQNSSRVFNREPRERTRKEDEDFEQKVGRGGSPRRLVATGVRKKLNREPRERTRKEDEDF